MLIYNISIYMLVADGGAAGMSTPASNAVPTMSRDSPNSTSSKEARALHAGFPMGDLSSNADPEKELAAADAGREQAPASAAVAEARQQQLHAKHGAQSASVVLTTNAHHHDEGDQEEAHRHNSQSNQSSESHQERRLDQGGLGQCGSHDFNFVYNEATFVKGSPDSGSDSADISSTGAKRSRSGFGSALQCWILFSSALQTPPQRATAGKLASASALVTVDQHQIGCAVEHLCRVAALPMQKQPQYVCMLQLPFD